MKRALIILIIILGFSCNEKKQSSKKEDNKTKKIEERNIQDLIVFENLLMNSDLKDAEYKNITFDKTGSLFSKSTPSYIKIPFSNIDLTQGFNLSFSFKTFDDDGTKPQSLIAFTDKFSSASRIPFYIYFPGNKVSGVYGKQLFWAEGYDAANGNSREYYDSFILNKNQPYFVSVNFDGEKAQIYLNSELYASFENLTPHDLKVEHILIGALLPNNKVANPFEGSIHGLKVFKEPLSEKEIVTIFNDQPEIGEDY